MKEDPPTRLGKMAPPVAGPSKMNPIVKRAPSLKVKAEVDDNTKEKDNSDEKERTKTVMEEPKEKSKATGKLDFSKAKKKETKKKESKEGRAEQKKKDLVKPPSTSNVKNEKVAEKVEPKVC
jgi:DNA polymerase delta subunit 3